MKQRIILTDSQQGMVSIIVTMVLMLVITIIVIGFAQISRREQTQSLDRQLSTQAFYAAESGVNDAAKAIQGYVSSGVTIPPKTSCSPDPPGGNYPMSNVIDPTPFAGIPNRLQYTCLLIDPTPQDQQATPPQGTSTVFALIPETGTIDTIKITWQNTGGDTTFNCPPTAGTFLPGSGASAWACSLAVYRIDIVPGGAFGSQASLQANTITLFLYPQDSGGVNARAITNADNGQIIPVRCTQALPSAPSCNMSLSVAPQSSFYLRALPIYKDNNTIDIKASSGGVPVAFEGGQAVIDATGKANDVLRRIKIYKDISNLNSSSQQTPFPDYAVQTFETMCKQLNVFPGSATTDSTDTACGLPPP